MTDTIDTAYTESDASLAKYDKERDAIEEEACDRVSPRITEQDIIAAVASEWERKRYPELWPAADTPLTAALVRLYLADDPEPTDIFVSPPVRDPRYAAWYERHRLREAALAAMRRTSTEEGTE